MIIEGMHDIDNLKQRVRDNAEQHKQERIRELTSLDERIQKDGIFAEIDRLLALDKEDYTISKSMLVYLKDLLVGYEKLANIALDYSINSCQEKVNELGREYMDIIACS